MFGHACVGIDVSERQVHTLGEAPTKRTGHSVVLFRDSLLAFGGLGFRVQGLGFCWLTCFMWKSWKSGAAGHIEIMRLLPEAEARPDTFSNVPVRQVLSGGKGNMPPKGNKKAKEAQFRCLHQRRCRRVSFLAPGNMSVPDALERASRVVIGGGCGESEKEPGKP